MGAIFGKSKSKSKSTSSGEGYNKSYDAVNAAFLPQATASYGAGVNALQGELASGYEGYKANTGFDFFKALGLRRTAGERSGRGLFNSGATMRALSNYEQQIGQASYNDYLAQQAQLANLGLQGGNLVVGAGNYNKNQSESTSTQTSSPGLAGFAGSIMSSGALGAGGLFGKALAPKGGG